MPPFSYRDIIKRIKKKGFFFLREGKGSHEIWINASGKKITVPHHKVIATGTVTHIAKDAGFQNLKGFKQQ